MRLINVHSRLLQEFYDAEVPEYAILSHTWGDDEVSYEDLTAGQARDKEAYKKIRFLCTQALADGLQWAWLDTCCIDKASSAELSEAINSMFRWYRRAQYCYAYLSDVPEDVYANHNTSADIYDVLPWLASSRWFKRGWCLQELIAPQRATFYGKGWNYFGDRDTLARAIARITGIRERVLLDPQAEVGRCSVAEKMSWAAVRETSRVEDTAYCLLGIFEVNMPMLYGEGTRAFQRLQEEIIKAVDDHSIFVWQPQEPDEHHLLLAPSPSRFRHGALVVTIQALHHVDGHTLGNTGLRISLPLSPVDHLPGCYHAILGCRYRDDYQHVIALCLQRRADTGLSEELNKPSPIGPATAALNPNKSAPVKTNKLPPALFVAPTIARSQRYIVERAPHSFKDFPAWPSLMISRALPVAEAQVWSAGAKYWIEGGETSRFSIIAAYPPDCFNFQSCVLDLTNSSIKYGAVLLSLSEEEAKSAGLVENTLHSQSVAVVFGSWNTPGQTQDEETKSVGIFGAVQSNLKNLSNACRLAVSKSIYRSADTSQNHVAWVRSTYLVSWCAGHYLDISFQRDRRVGILGEVVNVVSITLHANHEIAKTAPMALHRQTHGAGYNSLSIARLQDVVRSYEEAEIPELGQNDEGPRSDMVYELEDDSWRVHPPDLDDSGESDYEGFVQEAEQLEWVGKTVGK